MPAAANTASASVAELGVERAAQHLAPRREAGAHELEQALGIGDGDRRRGVPHEPHERAVDLRLAARTPSGGTVPTTSASA